jgi:oxygen-independent coproporphyrinogen-3 oxidase
MCDGRLDFAAVDDALGVHFESYFARELGEIESGCAALAAVDRGARVLRATPLGALLIRNLAMVFDRYLAPAPAGAAPRFSSSL